MTVKQPRSSGHHVIEGPFHMQLVSKLYQVEEDYTKMRRKGLSLILWSKGGKKLRVQTVLF